MKMLFLFQAICVLLIVLSLLLPASGDAEVVAYPGPEGITGADDYQVEVNGKPIFVYNVLVTYHDVAMTYFDFSGTVTVKITAKQPIHTADISPKSYGIIPKVDGNSLTFTLTQPRKLVIRIDPNEWALPAGTHQPKCRELHLFANALETTKPNLTDPNVRYFAPGVTKAGDIELADNQTLYVAGGAYVYGRIRATGKKNIKVVGRGIIDNPDGKGLLRFSNCTDAEIRGVIMVRSPGSWLCVINNSSRNVVIDDLKVFNQGLGGTDGIDICSSQDVTVNDCFVRVGDDNIVPKGYPKNSGNVQRIRITNCSIWSDGCRSLRIGPENCVDLIDDVLWKNIDIIKHYDTSHPVIGIDIGDHATASNIRFEDIRIEEVGGAPIIDLYVGPTYYSKDTERGHIKGVTFKNVDVLQGPYPSITSTWPGYADGRLVGIYGHDAGHQVEDITFENCHMLGKFIAKAEDANIQIRDFTKNIRFIPPADGSPVASFIVSPHTEIGAGQQVKFTAKDSFAQGSTIKSSHWTFADAGAQTGNTTTHQFDHLGRYMTELTVCDANGKVGHASVCIATYPLRPAVHPKTLTPGLAYTVFEDGSVAKKPEEPVLTKTGTCANVDMTVRSREKYFHILNQGYIDIPRDGVYGFKIRGAGENCHLDIDNQTVVNPVNFFALFGYGLLGLQKGKHLFTVYYKARDYFGFPPQESSELHIFWEGPDFTLQPLPNSVLFHQEQ